MERHEMLLKLKALKLHGMAAAFDEVIDEGIKRSRTPFDVLGRLLAAEDSERHARSIRYQMTGAKFPEYRELATFDFAESPVNEQQIRTLHEGGFTEETRNIVLVGGPGTGKSHLGLALAIQAVKTQSARALLQHRRSGQPARAGESGRQARSPRAAAHARGCRRVGRARILTRQRQRRRAAVSPDLETLRENQPDHHHQPVVLGVGQGVWRCQDDHGTARPGHPPLRHHRNRQRQLSSEETQPSRARQPQIQGENPQTNP